jgi:hypothetical protein
VGSGVSALPPDTRLTDHGAIRRNDAPDQHKGANMRASNWFKTVPALVIIGSMLCLVLAVGGGLLLWGSNFASNMVHSQLSAQKIAFPPKGPALDAKEFPGLQKYAGQTVDNGAKAKAYADQFIKEHLTKVAGGKTYSEASALSRANPNDQALAGQVDTLFRGETLRGLLLNVWGWATVGAIAYWVGIAALLGAIAVFGALVLGFMMHERQIKHAVNRLDDVRVPVSV